MELDDSKVIGLRGQFHFSYTLEMIYYVTPSNRRGGGHIVFGAEPVGFVVGAGVSIGIACCLRSI